MSIGLVVLYGLLGILALVALARGDETLRLSARRAVEQFFILVPRMFLALMASGFIARLIPSEVIARFLGHEAGFIAIVVASIAGLIVPAGPVIAFSIAAVFARSGASAPALIAFITSWSVFATHRIFIYEIPLLGPSFVRLRLVAAAATPILAGLLAAAVSWVVDIPLVAAP